MDQSNVNVGVLQVTKLPAGACARNSLGCNVVATAAPSQHSGGVAAFCRESDQWQLEAHQEFSPNVISFQLVTGRKRWHAVGAHVPPDSLSETNHIVEAFSKCPDGVDPVLAGNLNANVEFPECERDEEIAAAAAAEGLEDVSLHFLQKQNRRMREHTWSMMCQGEFISSKVDHILGTDRCFFMNVTVKEPHHCSDHRMVVGCLHSQSIKENRRHLGSRTRCPLKAPAPKN